MPRMALQFSPGVKELGPSLYSIAPSDGCWRKGGLVVTLMGGFSEGLGSFEKALIHPEVGKVSAKNFLLRSEDTK